MGSVAGTSGTDLVTEAIAELYAGDPDAFIQRRRELAGQARAAGDRAAAKAIGALGKPTRSAWVVNRLMHADPTVAQSLGELGGKLRSGEATLDGATIRELSVQRRELIDTLVRRALSEAGQDSPSVALRDDVTDTFNAALADPGVAEQVAAGTLQKAVHWAGFGPGIGSAVSSGPTGSAGTRVARQPAAARGRTASAGKTDAKARPGQTAKDTAKQQEAERKEAAGSAAREEQERREIVTRVEEAAAEADRAADAAAAAEREISDSVTFMQERLSREQQRLVAARRDTRQAAAAATRARQTLERIRRQFG
jgi:hypothetical protein